MLRSLPCISSTFLPFSPLPCLLCCFRSHPPPPPLLSFSCSCLPSPCSPHCTMGVALLGWRLIISPSCFYLLWECGACVWRGGGGGGVSLRSVQFALLGSSPLGRSQAPTPAALSGDSGRASLDWQLLKVLCSGELIVVLDGYSLRWQWLEALTPPEHRARVPSGAWREGAQSPQPGLLANPLDSCERS